MKQQSSLHKKRQDFRKEIRRESLHQKFKKIRYQLLRIRKNEIKDQQTENTIQGIINFINKNQIIFLQSDRKSQNDIMGKKGLGYFLKMYEEELTPNDLNLVNVLRNSGIAKRVQEKWDQMFKWMEQFSEVVEQVISKITDSLSEYIYSDEIIYFLLNTIDFLIEGNKVIRIKKIALDQKQEKFIVGNPPKYFWQKLRIKCLHLLTNLTATEHQQLLLPYLKQISRTISQSSQFSQIYFNIFLTANIPLAQKFQMFNEYLQLMQRNPQGMKVRGETYIKILMIIYSMSPGIVNCKVGTMSSLECSYKCLEILDSYLGIMNYRIEEVYGVDPFKEDFDVVFRLTVVLFRITQEGQDLLFKIPQKLNVVKFFENRLKRFSTVPQIKCVKLIVKSLARISSYKYIFEELQGTSVVIGIQLNRIFEKVLEEFFPIILEQNQNIQTQIQLKDQLTIMKLECMDSICRIYSYMCDTKDYFIKFYETGKVSKLLRVAFRSREIQERKLFYDLKNNCLEVAIRVVSFLVELGKDQDQIGIILLDNFFSPPQQQNIISHIQAQFEAASLDRCNPIILQLIINFLHNTILTACHLLQTHLQSIGDQNINEIQNNPWAIMFQRMQQRALKELRVLSSSCKLIVNSNRVADQVNNVFGLCDNLKLAIGKVNAHVFRLIELEE